MDTIELDEETVERLDGIKVQDESYDELINELINIYQAQEMTLSYGATTFPELTEG